MKILIIFLILFTLNSYLSIHIYRNKEKEENNLNIYYTILVGINIVAIIYILYLLYENKIDIVLKK